MALDGLKRTGDRAWDAFTRLRLRLQSVMPKVALAAAALFVLRLLIVNTYLYRETFVGLLGPLTFIAVSATLLYYGLKLLVRLKRKLLWRVRRRLIITYLFVGLTPIVLLLLLGLLAAVVGSSQAMVRVVTVELNATERQTLDSARTLAAGLLDLPANAGESGGEEWLDARAGMLRATLPGARVAVWRGGAGEELLRLGEDEEALLTSADVDEETRGVGFDAGAASAERVPAWLKGVSEWGGFAYLPPPADSRSAHGTPAMRALVRRAQNGRGVAVLVTVPVSRALIDRLRENTGVNVRPFFLGASGTEARQRGGSVEFNMDGADEQRALSEDGRFTFERDGEVREVDFRRDQFGEVMPEPSLSDFNFWYPVFLPATNWLTGRQTPQWSFMVDWSWSAGGKQFWSDVVLGEAWWQVLYTLAVAFLVLELLALLSAAWMTRAVTGTVHKLHLATQHMRRGDFSHRIRTRSRDQLGELALAFNDMSANIETLLAERVERERLEREVEIAAEVQAQLFPRSVPALSTASITGECRAARGVAGDYYDYIEIAPGLVAIALGDVSGKGLSASLVMSNLQAALRAQAASVAERVKIAERRRMAASGESASRHAAATTAASAGQSVDVEEVVVASIDNRNAVAGMTASVNEQLCRSTDDNRYATLFLALYDDRTRTLRYTNSGHNAPALVRADGSVERLTTGGTMVGAFDWVEYEEGEVALEAGDLLVLFSDGISEAVNEREEEFGEERIMSLASERRDETASNLRRDIFKAVDEWTGARERYDDQTLVILKATSRE